MARVLYLLYAVGVIVLLMTCLWGAGILNNNNNNRVGSHTSENTTARQNYLKHLLDTQDDHPNGNLNPLDSYTAFTQAQQEIVNKYVNSCKHDQRITNLTDEFTVSDGVPSMVGAVIYINMKDHADRDEFMKTQFRQWALPTSTDILRFEAVKEPKNGAKGCYLSHMHALAWGYAHTSGHVLVLEDDFVLDVTREEMEAYMAEADRVCSGRWDVIVLGQYVQKWQPLSLTGKPVFRLLHSTTTSGYLVNRRYLKDLLTKWHESYQPRKDLNKFQHDDNLDQIQIAFQKKDLWLGFDRALGSQRNGMSTIGHNMVHNTWKCNDKYNIWYESDGRSKRLQLLAHWKRRKVAVCFVATGKYREFLPMVTLSCVKRFLKPHLLEFFIFTDAPAAIPEDFYGCQNRVYTIERQGFPGDTLYRYHYMLKAEKALQEMDYFYYMDVDYWVCNVPEENKLLCNGLVATSHLHNLHIKDSSTALHRGSPDTNPASTACIRPDERMNCYFSGGFQGGTSSAFLQACHTLKQRIDTDDQNGVMALWHDESHWNRYLLDYPPAEILTSAYVFPEPCLEPGNTTNNCKRLREKKLYPIMVAIEKNHKLFRETPE